jgi:3-hydroxymyristoyl/3-hydroxydecanoyl-(acyl carrier protein) dehydratase
MPSASLPHGYPFRFVDRIVEERDEAFTRGRVQLLVTAGQRAVGARRWQSPFLLAEAVAQSALLLQGGDPEIGRSGFLAGLEAFEFARDPSPGERLTVEVALEARYGRILKFSGVVSNGDETLARGVVLVREGEPK